MELKHLFFIILIICTFIYSCEGKKGEKKKKSRKGREGRGKEECALFKDPDLWYVKEKGPSYIKLDQYDFTGDLDISFWILPDRTIHNGPLFNVGSEDNFKYYEWKTKAVHTQFLVVEITYTAVALLVKVLKQKHLHQFELFRTHPKPYNLIDGHWQYISAYRKDAIWTLSLNDSVVLNEPVRNQTDINLYGRTAFLGGRPDYTDNVFRGIIKGVRVNGELVSLSGREMAGNAEVRDCDSDEIQEFARQLVGLEEENDIGYAYQGDGYYDDDYYYPDEDGRVSKWKSKLKKKKGHKGSYVSYHDFENNRKTDQGPSYSIYGIPV